MSITKKSVKTALKLPFILAWLEAHPLVVVIPKDYYFCPLAKYLKDTLKPEKGTTISVYTTAIACINADRRYLDILPSKSVSEFITFVDTFVPLRSIGNRPEATRAKDVLKAWNNRQ